MTYCEKHELSNCAECSGAARRCDAAVNAQPLQAYADDVLPVVPGASVIRAQYGGNCSTCGRRYSPQAVIFNSRVFQRGWQGYDCCA